MTEINRFGLIPLHSNLEKAEEKELVYLSEHGCFGFKYEGKIFSPYLISEEKISNHLTNKDNVLHFIITDDIDNEILDGFYMDKDNKNLLSKKGNVIKSLCKFKEIEKGDIYVKHLEPKVQSIINKGLDDTKVNKVKEMLLSMDSKLTELTYDFMLRQNTDTSSNFNKFFIDINEFENSVLKLDKFCSRILSKAVPISREITIPKSDNVMINDTLIIQSSIKYNILKVTNVNTENDITTLIVDGLADEFDINNTLVYKSLIEKGVLTNTLDEKLLPYKHEINKFKVTPEFNNNILIKGTGIESNKHHTIDNGKFFITFDNDKLYIHDIKDSSIDEIHVDISGITYCYSFMIDNELLIIFTKNNIIYQYNHTTKATSELCKGQIARAVLDNKNNIHYIITGAMEVRVITKIYKSDIIVEKQIVTNISNKACFDMLWDNDTDTIYALYGYSPSGNISDYQLYMYKSIDYGNSYEIIEIDCDNKLIKDAKITKLNKNLVITYSELDKSTSMSYNESSIRYMMDNKTEGNTWDSNELYVISDTDIKTYDIIDKVDTINDGINIGLLYLSKGILKYTEFDKFSVLQANPINQHTISTGVYDFHVINNNCIILSKDSKLEIIYDDNKELIKCYDNKSLVNANEFFITLVPDKTELIKYIDLFITTLDYIHDIDISIISNKGTTVIHREDISINNNTNILKYSSDDMFELYKILIHIKNPYNVIQKITDIIGTLH